MKINSSNNVSNNISDDDKKKKPEKENKTEVNPTPLLEKDKINLSNPPKNNNINSDNIKLFDSEKEDTKPNGWKVKSVNVNAGYIVDNKVIHNGPMHIVNQNYGTDLTITGYKQKDRTNWENIDPTSGERFAPDEPQSNIGVNVTFENNFGIEIDGKHNKIIMDGYDQNVHFNGMMNGNYVNMDAPLNTFMAQHEHTYGNMEISALGTYSFDLPAPKNNKFTFITKAGPSLITSATHGRIKNPSGEWESTPEKLQVVGYGGMLENGLRYQFGPKVGRLGVEVTHAFSYLNYANYSLGNGTTGSHSAVNSQFALKLTLGLYGNKK